MRLAPGGVLACEIATVQNLERHAKPSRRFLLELGELPRLCAPLEVVHYTEGWQGDRCLARILARRTSPARSPVTSSSDTEEDRAWAFTTSRSRPKAADYAAR